MEPASCGGDERRGRVEPTIPTFASEAYGAWMYGAAAAVPAGRLHTPGGFHSFEHRWALREAFEWRQRLGRRDVAARTHALAARLRERLDGARGLALVTPRDPAVSAGLLMLAPLRRGPDDVVGALRRRGIVASVTPYRERFVRLGPSIVNDEDDVDEAALAVRAVV